MLPEQMRQAFEAVIDESLIYHGFTPYFRDYQVIWDVGFGPGSTPGRDPQHPFIRWIFVGCVRVEASLDPYPNEHDPLFSDRYVRDADGRIDALEDDPPSGFVWGVEFLAGYPGARLVEPSPLASQMSEKYSETFYEALIEVPPQTIRLIFHDLKVASLPPGIVKARGVHLVLDPL